MHDSQRGKKTDHTSQNVDTVTKNSKTSGKKSSGKKSTPSENSSNQEEITY